jgi:uncharacterized membrane protein YfcA
MTIVDYALLVLAGVVGGGVNAIAGGGTFFTFPAFMAVGLDPLTANASNAVAIYPGHAGAVPAYRAELAALPRALLLRRAVIAGTGGLLGALLLLVTGNAMFAPLVPWLLGMATLIFALGPRLRRLAERANLHSPLAMAIIEFVFAVYGGYFGAGLGVLLLAVLTIVGVTDIQSANAQKNLLGAIITTIAVVLFVSAGVVAWRQTLVVLAGAVIGGYCGARLARRVPAGVLRGAVILVGGLLTVYYFAKGA